MERKKLDDITVNKYERLIKRAAAQIKQSAYGKFLLERFPLHLTSATEYAAENRVLIKTGSPACTDGKDVYVSAETTGAFFESIDFKEWSCETPWRYSVEELWEKNQPGEESRQLSDEELVSEIRDILLHEFTHAVNKHPKLQRAARSKSENYQQRLAVACEIQANDGIMGRTYSSNYSQQPNGVTNKRQHPETIGMHTLSDIMRKLDMPNKSMLQQSSAASSKDATEQMMKATGADKQWDAEIQQEAQQEQEHKEEAGKGGAMGGDKSSSESELMSKTTDQNMSEQLSKATLNSIKNMILSAISKELSYDAATDSVVFNQHKKRISSKTYSRPSKRQSTSCGGVELLRKGVRRKRIIEYDESNDLLVLAVDASGSMGHQEEYVSKILDGLIEQVDKLVAEQGVSVNWENLLATQHTTQANRLVSAKSDNWANQMRHYRADGGNDFDCVLRQIDYQLLVDEKREYNSITVLNLSDGLDVLNSDWCGTELEKYMAAGKLRWVDALIGSSSRLQDAERAKREDVCNIREQVVLAVDYR